MSTITVFMMAVTIILVWGGFVAPIVLLKVPPNTWEPQEEESSSHRE